MDVAPSCMNMSPFSRRAWIEIYSRYCGSRKGGVALLAEGVDRNLHIPTVTPKTSVALLAEGVDRNTYGYSM